MTGFTTIRLGNGAKHWDGDDFVIVTRELDDAGELPPGREPEEIVLLQAMHQGGTNAELIGTVEDMRRVAFAILDMTGGREETR